MQEPHKPHIEKERAEFKALIRQNPNYFGTAPKTRAAAVAEMKGNTKYEELACVGLHPEQDLLQAILRVKLPFGYKGDLCSKGSYEYIRFYVDWDGDGTFDDPGEDVGIASVNVHDIPDAEAPCLDKTKPISYAVSLKIDPTKKPCKYPQLVKVRAILSWEDPPLPGDPDHIPVWGNVLEKWIQIDTVDFLLAHVVEALDLTKLGIDASILDLNSPISKKAQLSVAELEKAYANKDVPQHRVNFTAIHQIAQTIKKTPSLAVQYQLDPQFAKIKEYVELVIKADPNTAYEQLECVGLDYDQERLVATLRVKLPCGYGGNLCSAGTDEHIAFWIYVHDEIEQMCLWQYAGTARVNVHDIAQIPPEGLQYAVSLPVDLSNLRKKCSKPVVLKVRGILSWNHAPDIDDPDYSPVWGNRLDARIQPKPGVPANGKQIPYLWSFGDMAVESISGNPHTLLVSALGDGYGNGVSVGHGYTAVESPFGGVVKISGTITNAPNNPVEADKLKYKVQYRKSDESWKDIEDTFRIWIRIDGVPSGHLDQVASGGYFKYQKDLTAPVIREVQDDVLAIWYTPSTDGLYEVRVLLYQLGALQPGVPADHVSSSVIKIRVDNTPPKAKVSLDLGACEQFTVGDTIYGKFTATDSHIWTYRLTVTPSVANPPVISPTGQTYPLLAAPGLTDEQFTVTTEAATTPCGYVIRLEVWDRTIRNNYMPGNWNYADVGLCLLEAE